jgi:nitrate/nitrite transporter NarK
VGAERAEVVVALQAALMRAVGAFGAVDEVEQHRPRVLATAAALDYVLMLATGTTGVRIPERDAERAMHEGIARAVDDLIAVAGAVGRSGTPEAVAFARETAGALRGILREEALETDERSFAVIALANA